MNEVVQDLVNGEMILNHQESSFNSIRTAATEFKLIPQMNEFDFGRDNQKKRFMLMFEILKHGSTRFNILLANSTRLALVI